MNEELLYQIWEHQCLTKHQLTSNSGRSIEIIYPGIFDRDKGPDFKFCRYRIDGEICTGDVEIEVSFENWYHHKHSSNQDFRNVHLLVVMHSCADVTLIYHEMASQPIEIVSLEKIIDRARLTEIQASSDESQPQPFCPLYRSDEPVHLILKNLGIQRINQKLNRFQVRYQDLELFDELIFQGIMESLGYSRNKENFLRLASLFPLRTIRQKVSSIPAGQIPYYLQWRWIHIGKMEPWVKEHYPDYLQWLTLKINKCSVPLEIESIQPTIPWNYHRVRPFNQPFLRLLFMSFWLVEKIKHGLTEELLLHFFSESDTLDALHQFLILDASLISHPLIRLPYNLGHDRQRIILFNILLPLLLIFFRLETETHQETKIWTILENFPALADNFPLSLVRRRYGYMNRVLPADNSALIQQGWLQLFREYCQKGLCSTCLLGDK